MVISQLQLAILEQPESLGNILATVEKAARLSMDDTSPSYMAYIPSGGLFHSAVADFLSTSLNRFVTINEAAPALARIEDECVQWLCRDIANFPNSSTVGGVLTSGGSLANLIAVHCARRAAMGNIDLPKATIYVSQQAHYCVAQSARFVGLLPKHIHAIPSFPNTVKMDTDVLRSQVADDIAAGLQPVCIVATAGTTNTGAVDDVEACRAVCDDLSPLLPSGKSIWLHVDAAYGGAFALCDEGRAILGDLSLADSVVVDPHKGLFLPYGLGALLVKDRSKLLRANHEDGACMQPPAFFEGIAGEETHDLMNLSPELTREFRGLKLWLPLKVHGVEAWRTALKEKLELTRIAEERIKNSGVERLKIVHASELSVFTFKLVGGGTSTSTTTSGAELDELNVQFLKRIHEKGRVLLSPFRSVSGKDGELCLRMCVLSYKTGRTAVDAAVDDIIEAAKQLTTN
jgi:aromatic-L-amino-acid decarboxylase